MSAYPGQTLGNYRLIEQIGRGGMATVYKALQPSLSRYVAIKILPASYADDPTFLERFRREAVVVASLRHPNILVVFDSGEQDGVTYFVTELIQGGTLRERLGFPMPLADVTKLLRPVASALDYAHSQGVIHRDVKPSNVLMGQGETPILADFGIARIVESVSGLTQTGVGIGTPEYMAPEQAMGQPVGPSCDVYALGVVAYQMLTGTVPFSASTPMAVAVAQITTPVPLPQMINPAISDALQAVLLKALTKAPDGRYPTAIALVQALEQVAADEGLAQPSGTATTQIRSREALLARGPQDEIRATPLSEPDEDQIPPRAGVQRATRPKILLIGSATVAALALIAALVPPYFGTDTSSQRTERRVEGGSGAGVAALVTPVPTATERELPPSPTVAVATLAVATPTPTADERWERVSASLDSVWRDDWVAAIAMIDEFLADVPDHAQARSKLYAALVEDGKSQLGRGELAGGISRLVRAQELDTQDFEADLLLFQLTPTATLTVVPTATARPPTPIPARPTVAQPQPATAAPVAPISTLRPAPQLPPTATLRLPGS